MKALSSLLASGVLLSCLLPAVPVDAQLRRPGFIIVEREDRSESQLVQEDGAIYLEGMVTQPVKVRIAKEAPAYATLTADRWMGNVLANQNGVLLAVSERAYRVRAKAKQGQIAGWISKAAVTGLPPGFEAALTSLHERFLAVRELIDNHQVALGMTVDEVAASIGPPDKRSSTVTKDGRTDTMEYISYERVPQTVTTYNSFGAPVPATQYVEVESGRVTIDFENNVAVSIKETEGIDLAPNGIYPVVPRPVLLF